MARLHEFFHTFDGHTHITTASEGEPAAESVASEEVPLSGRQHEPAFGTGAPVPGEPHDVTLQGNGNFAPDVSHPELALFGPVPGQLGISFGSVEVGVAEQAFGVEVGQFFRMAWYATPDP